MSEKNKIGRPSIMSYEKFVEVWVNLIEEGRARINTVQEILGGSKSTIADFRERYEREQSAEKLALIRDVELPESVQRAIADIKVKQITELEKENQHLRTRLDEQIQHLKEAEDTLILAKTEFDERKAEFIAKEKDFNCKLAASEALRAQTEKNEEAVIAGYDELREQLNKVSQEAAVAKKEVSMLREKMK